MRNGTLSVTRVRDYRIHALETGAGDHTIVLLHGLSGSIRWWKRNVDELAREARVIVPDLIGFGRSRGVARIPKIEELADLLLEWFDVMAVRRLVLAGHSMGGQISVHVAARAPGVLERLVLADPSGIPRPISMGEIARFAAQVAPLWRWGDPTFLPVIAGDALKAGPRTLLRAIRHILADDVRPLLPRIRVPTLIVWGERDTLVPLSHAWEFRQAIPNARVAVLRGAGHNSMVDRPSDFNRLVLRFMEGVPVGR